MWPARSASRSGFGRAGRSWPTAARSASSPSAPGASRRRPAPSTPDPYTRAGLERSGEIPLALGEGLQLVARVDDAGRPLDPRCVYHVGSRIPAARYWTLSLVDREGFPVENAAGRYGFRSSEILRDADGDFSIFVSASAHAGNWLPIGAPAPFALVLRLYNSPLSATAGGIEKNAAPSIAREGCA